MYNVSHKWISRCAAEPFVSIFRHLKLELLTQFPASNDYFIKFDEISIDFKHAWDRIYL